MQHQARMIAQCLDCDMQFSTQEVAIQHANTYHHTVQPFQSDHHRGQPFPSEHHRGQPPQSEICQRLQQAGEVYGYTAGPLPAMPVQGIRARPAPGNIQGYGPMPSPPPGFSQGSPNLHGIQGIPAYVSSEDYSSLPAASFMPSLEQQENPQDLMQSLPKKEFDFDKETGRGVCYVCGNLELLSKSQAGQHLKSSGHKEMKRQWKDQHAALRQRGSRGQPAGPTNQYPAQAIIPQPSGPPCTLPMPPYNNPSANITGSYNTSSINESLQAPGDNHSRYNMSLALQQHGPDANMSLQHHRPDANMSQGPSVGHQSAISWNTDSQISNYDALLSLPPPRHDGPSSQGFGPSHMQGTDVQHVQDADTAGRNEGREARQGTPQAATPRPILGSEAGTAPTRTSPRPEMTNPPPTPAQNVLQIDGQPITTDCIEAIPGLPYHYKCTVCETTISSGTRGINVQQHLLGKSHKKVLDRQALPFLTTSADSTVPEDDDDKQYILAVAGAALQYKCTLCDQIISGEINCDQHLKGKAHNKKKMEAVRMSNFQAKSRSTTDTTANLPGVPAPAQGVINTTETTPKVLDSDATLLKRPFDIDDDTTLLKQRLDDPLETFPKQMMPVIPDVENTIPGNTSEVLSNPSSISSCQSSVTPNPVVEINHSKGSRLSEASNRSGTFINEYVQLAKLGSGGFGAVYKVEHKLDKKRYAVKKIKTSQRCRGRTEREVRALALLSEGHKNIVKYYHCWIEMEEVEPAPTPPATKQTSSSGGICFQDSQAGDQSGGHAPAGTSSSANTESSSETSDSSSSFMLSTQHENSLEPGQMRLYMYIKMELCKHDLASFLKERRKRNPLHMKDIFKQIVEGVHFIHQNDMIHRDLKPQNVFFAEDDSIKLGDFGLIISHQMEQELSGGGSSMRNAKHSPHTRGVGTESYMSPEQGREGTGEYDKRVDLYPLGLILVELLHVFQTETEKARTFSNLRKNPGALPSETFTNLIGEGALASSLLSHSPTARPDTAVILEKLKLFMPGERLQYPLSHF